VSDVPDLQPHDVHNKTLLDNVHPSDWENPTPEGRYNLVVIGGGTAGLISAIGAAGLGAKVALIERHFLGGDCLNHGCVPSKGVIGAARVAHTIRESAEFGMRVPDSWEIDFGVAMERMRRIRADISGHDSAKRFQSLGVDVYLGQARFVDGEHVEVGDSRLRFKKAVIATGARASLPPIPGLAESGCYTNETIFSLTERPTHLAIIGGGPIGCELAQAFQRLGSQVTLLEVAPEILIREDPDAAEVVRRSILADGVVARTGVKISRVETSGGKTQIVLEGDGGEEHVEADTLLVAAGRAPNVADLGLEGVGVDFDERKGVKVDDTLRTTNPRIYACGDVCQALKFTHAADAAARIVIRNTLFPFLPKSKSSKLLIPWVTYTSPEIAHVGITEHDAKANDVAIDTITVALAENDRAQLEGDTEGVLKIHVAKGTDRILGGTLVSAHAGESIGELTLAISQGVKLGKFSGVIHPYPTQAEVFKRAGDAMMRTKFKPWVAKLFSWIIARQR
jgi:pyruvate/2-oxoglutarate dehydrogenase complex dihydrolipoamide dehydrogenase (E3) component